MIGGNITTILQVSATTKNEIGESVKSWHDVMDGLTFLQEIPSMQHSMQKYRNLRMCS